MRKKICCLILFLMTSGVVLSSPVHVRFSNSIAFQFDDGEAPPVEDPTPPVVDDGEGPPVEDPPPPAPINRWIPIAMIAGVTYMGYKTLRKGK